MMLLDQDSVSLFHLDLACIDRGAAVYFEMKGKPVSLACDKWNRVEDNIWAIAKHIEALRGQQRWGVGSIEQAFRGYTALPAIGESSASEWWKTRISRLPQARVRLPVDPPFNVG